MSPAFPRTLPRGLGRALIGVALAVALPAAWAHAIWFAQRSGELAVIYGHGAEDLDTVKRLPRLSPPAAYDDGGQPVSTSLRPTDRLVLVDVQADPALITLQMDNGLWSQMPDGRWVGKGRDEVPDARHTARYLKYAVLWRRPLQQPLAPLPGQRLQILPERARLPQHAGERLVVRLVFDGRPVAGVRVIADTVNDPDARPLVSDARGRVTLRVRNQGLNVVAATYRSPSEDPGRSDATDHLATLSFVLSHRPE